MRAQALVCVSGGGGGCPMNQNLFFFILQVLESL